MEESVTKSLENTLRVTKKVWGGKILTSGIEVG